MKRYYLKETVETFDDKGRMTERRVSETFEDEIPDELAQRAPSGESSDWYKCSPYPNSLPSPWWGVVPPNFSNNYETISAKDYILTYPPACGPADTHKTSYKSDSGSSITAVSPSAKTTCSGGHAVTATGGATTSESSACDAVAVTVTSFNAGRGNLTVKPAYKATDLDSPIFIGGNTSAKDLIKEIEDAGREMKFRVC